MKKMKKLQDLQSNLVDVETMGLIAEDMDRCHIRNLRIGTDRFVLFGETKKKIPQRSNIELFYESSELGKGYHEVSCNAKIRFIYRRRHYMIHVVVHASARYFKDDCELRMQDYLYTYLDSIIKNCDPLQKIKGIHLPETLDAYFREPVELIAFRGQKFHWIDTDGSSSVSILQNSMERFPEFLEDTPLEKEEETITEAERVNQNFLEQIYSIRKREKGFFKNERPKN